jgi:hypothetical protein
LLLLGILTGAPLCADPPPSAAAPSWHIVRPGDTLDEILARYLGQDAERATGLRLNPQIRDPDLIYPGRRIRLFVDPREATLPTARLDSVGAGVEELPRPVSWIAALDGDLLLEGDGLRTFDSGSAQLLFDDGSRVAATENALLFVRRPRDFQAPREVRVLEVVRGRADLELTAKPTEPSRFEVVLGEARASGAVAPGTRSSRSRVRNEERGTSKLMMYAGDAAIAAQGTRIEVPEGTGTSVPPGAAPRPAEPLLEAPRLLAPTEGEPLAYSNPWVRWTEVAGAASYHLEVCADAECGLVLEIRPNLIEPRHQPLIQRAQGFFRVRAISATGLDGYPSPVLPYGISELVPDLDPPTLIVTPGAWGEPPVVQASDLRSGVAGIWFTLDGGVERPIGELTATLRGLGGAVPGRLEVIARDRVGLETRSGPVDSGADTTPPEIRVEVLPASARQGDAMQPWRDELHFDWPATSPGWQPWRPAGGRRRWLPRGGPGLSYSAPAGIPSIDFVARRSFDVEGLAPLPEGEVLRISCSDAHSGLARCSVARPVPGSGAAVDLEIEAIDRAGNRSRRAIALR